MKKKPPVYLRIWFIVLLFFVGFFGVLATLFSLLLWPIDAVLMVMRIRWSVAAWKERRESEPGVAKEILPSVSASKDSLRYLVFDVETPNRLNDRISSIGIALIENWEIIEEKEYLVNPETVFDIINTNITGISKATVANAPIFPVIWQEMKELFSDSILVAHNAKFDLSVLNKTLSAYNLTLKPVKYICTMEMAKGMLPELDKYGLDKLCSYYGIELKHHQSGSDSLACAQLFLRMHQAGAPFDKYESVYQFVKETIQPARTISQSMNLSDTSISLNKLLSLLKTVTANKLTEEGLYQVRTWIETHKELEGNYPYEPVCKALQSVPTGVPIEQSELDKLASVFSAIVDPVAASQHIDKIDCNGKIICLSGEFVHKSRSEMQEFLEGKGATVRKAVSGKTDYLIVGEAGSEAWLNKNYGTKVKNALEFQAKGAKVQIIREKDFFKAIEGL